MTALEAVRAAIALLPSQQALRSDSDALALAVHATLELDGLCPRSAFAVVPHSEQSVLAWWRAQRCALASLRAC